MNGPESEGRKDKFSHPVEIELETGVILTGQAGSDKRQSLAELLNSGQPFLMLKAADGAVHMLARSRIIRVSEAAPPPDRKGEAMALLGVDEYASYADLKSAYILHSKRCDIGMLEEIGADADDIAQAREMTARLKSAFQLLSAGMSE